MASSSSSNPEKKLIKLVAGDQEVFEVEESIAMMSVTVKAIIEDDCGIDTGIPVPHVTGPVLAKVIEYCKKHVNDKTEADSKTDLLKSVEAKEDDEALKAEKDAEKAMRDWDKEFAKLAWPELTELLLAANFLNIQGLLDLLCKTAADEIKDMSVEKVRETFNIECDFTPEEEAKIRADNAWAFEVDEKK